MGIIGDSKSAVDINIVGDPGWAKKIFTDLNADYNSTPGLYFAEDTPRNWAVGGWTSVNIAAAIDSFLTAHTLNSKNDYNIFLINLGTGDLFYGTSEADYKTAMLYIVDAVKVKYPNAICFISKPWRRGYNTEATTMAGWVDDIVAARSTFCYVGDDENVWMKGADDGATMTFDGVHYSVAGDLAKEAAVRAVLGY